MGGKSKSREDVIKDFKEIWGDFYDYSEMEYSGWDKKIRIICPVHGPFEQSCNNHRRHGCPVCGHIKNAASQRGSVSYDFEGFDGCTEFFWYTPEVFKLLEGVE